MPRTPTDWEAEWKKIQKESRTLAKRANQRLVRLKRASEKPGMSNILKYAYKSAVADIMSIGNQNPEKPRFKENVKLEDAYEDEEHKIKITGTDLFKVNIKTQKAKIKMMKEFLGAASSTIGTAISGAAEGINKAIGIKRIWNKRTQTINEKYLKEYDLRLSDNDMKRFFDSKKQAKLETNVGSDNMFIVAAYINKYKIKTNKRFLEKFLKEHIDLEKYSDKLTEEDLKTRKGEGYREYLDRLKDYVSYTGDRVLDDYITKALMKGINVDNIFLQDEPKKKK